MSRRIQLCSRTGNRPDELPILRGPFVCEAGDYSFGVVIVRARGDGIRTRSIIETRSGQRIGRVVVQHNAEGYRNAIDAVMRDLIWQHGTLEVARRVQAAPTLAYMEAKT